MGKGGVKGIFFYFLSLSLHICIYIFIFYFSLISSVAETNMNSSFYLVSLLVYQAIKKTFNIWCVLKCLFSFNYGAFAQPTDVILFFISSWIWTTADLTAFSSASVWYEMMGPRVRVCFISPYSSDSGGTWTHLRKHLENRRLKKKNLIKGQLGCFWVRRDRWRCMWYLLALTPRF